VTTVSVDGDAALELIEPVAVFGRDTIILRVGIRNNTLDLVQFE
jgi:hypothetical protein